MKVHFIQHDPWVEPGEYLNWANRRACGVSITRCWCHDPLPRKADADLLVVLGGYQNPGTTQAECDYFDAAGERELIRQYVGAGRAVIGVCLGAQLVGEALGAPYAHSPEKEIGPVRAKLTAAGKEHPFLKGFPEVFEAGEWHNDMPGLTEEAVILAESDGCPRQIVQYGPYVYGFQTHMEFTHEIIVAGIADIGGTIREQGRFIQTAEALLSWDCGGMNRMLSGFLDAMADSYLASKRVPVARVMSEMIAISQGNIHDIDHLIRVWTYAKTIGELENLDADTQYILELAAITHDIACPLCREKYGNTNGRHQEAEGAPMAAAFLRGLGVDGDHIERVAWLVGHHHTFTGVDGVDYQILLEADYIANASENGYSDRNIRSFVEKIVKTSAGRRLIERVFCL